MRSVQATLSEPLWRAEDLGRPIPHSSHAVSVCLPRWADVIGYEEGEPRVIEAMKTGYPRFFHHPACCRLFGEYERRLDLEGGRCLVFPSRAVAERCAAYVHQMGERAEVWAPDAPDAPPGVHAVCVEPNGYERAKEYWRHTGEGISSRLAERCLNGAAGTEWDGSVKPRLRRRIAELAGARPEDVWLFPTGMAAIFTLHRALRAHRPEARSVQYGFPYVDTLKILQKFGPGAYFHPHGSAEDMAALETRLARETIAGIFTEVPANPLLVTPDLARLAEVAQSRDVPLVIDDTLATWLNVDVLGMADALCTSLTKFFSGVGDVAGGCVVLNRRGPHYALLRETLDELYEDLLDEADAVVLEHNSADFTQRLPRINANADRLAAFLHEHPKVETVYYPRFQTPERYRAVQRAGGGYGGLLSIALRDGMNAAPRFYDHLRLCKGPNLGTDYTLVCPYTMIAHYDELAFVESCGVPRHLIRMSVGLEEADHLLETVSAALDAA